MFCYINHLEIVEDLDNLYEVYHPPLFYLYQFHSGIKMKEVEKETIKKILKL